MASTRRQLRLEWAGSWTVVEDLPQAAPVRKAPGKADEAPRKRRVHVAHVQIALFDWHKIRRGRTWPKSTVQFSGTRLRPHEVSAIGEVARTLELYEDQRPRTRGDCLAGGVNEQRPCPWVSCAHHLAIDVNDAGSLRSNFPGMGVDEMPATCALDIAEDEDHPMRDANTPLRSDRVGFYVNTVKTNIQRIERVYLDKLAHALADGDREELAMARKNIKAQLTRFVGK